MDEKIFQIILALIPVIGAIISAYAIPYIKAKTANEDLLKYKNWAKIAVECAEMLFAHAPDSGEDKKAYCIKQLTAILNANKVIITSEQMEMLIEAAVKELHIAEKQLSSETNTIVEDVAE